MQCAETVKYTHIHTHRYLNLLHVYSSQNHTWRYMIHKKMQYKFVITMVVRSVFTIKHVYCKICSVMDYRALEYKFKTTLAIYMSVLSV